MTGERIFVDELPEIASNLKAGQRVLLTGNVYTARDEAHKRINELLDMGKPVPFPISGSVIYYAGPTPAPEGKIIGSVGPTTSGRMNRFAPRLFDLGLAATIGKGPMSREVVNAIKRNGAVYFCALGGAGALAAQCVKRCDEIAFLFLGCESVKRLYVEDFPLVVAINSSGDSIFKK